MAHHAPSCNPAFRLSLVHRSNHVPKNLAPFRPNRRLHRLRLHHHAQQHRRHPTWANAGASATRPLPQAQIRSEADAETGEITLITLPQKIEVFALLNDNTQQITWLETPSPACRTAHGIRPRMALRDAEKTLGKVRDIELSAVEMRQFARFTQQPKWLNIRVRGGDFGNMPSAHFRLPLHSKKFRRDARIESLFITQ